MKMSPKQQMMVSSIITIFFMTGIMTSVLTVVNAGTTAYLFHWLKSWATAFVIATPVMLIISPIIRSWVSKVTS